MRKSPFFCYYGGKFRVAKTYPAPLDCLPIVEPFAGAAGYSMRWGAGRRCALYDLDEMVVSAWRYILSDEPLPLEMPAKGHTVTGSTDRDNWLRMCANDGSTGRNTFTDFAAEQIHTKFRAITSQREDVRHWSVALGSYEQCPDIEATWFVDPPYSSAAGAMYRKNKIDYQHLAEWCRSRRGRVIVCENEGATWLPFDRSFAAKGMPTRRRSGFSREVYSSWDS